MTDELVNYTGAGITAGAAGGAVAGGTGPKTTLFKRAIRCTPAGRLLGNEVAGGFIGGVVGALIGAGSGAAIHYSQRKALFRQCEVKELRERQRLLRDLAACYRTHGGMWQ